jgi:predicted SAM-dependent methyltransferase
MPARQRGGFVRNILFLTFNHRTLALLRWDLHFLWLRFKNCLLLKNRALRRAVVSASKPIYLNLGSGPRGLANPHWINVDGYPDANVHYLIDFSRPWPIPDESLDGIFCEHVFEHFDFAQGQSILRQALRVLRPGGSMRIIVPDGGKIVRSYCSSPSELLSHRKTETSLAMDAVNSYFRQRYEHQFIYDWPLLEHQLKAAGFDQVAEVSLGKGKASIPIILDDQGYEWESLYVEAIKPTAK